MKKVIAIVGNNADKSTNRQLIHYIEQRYSGLFNIEVMEVKEFPLFNKPANMQLPDFVKEQVERIEACDGVIIATPEYDHAPPAALTNAISWMSYGVYPFASKPVLITGASYGLLGTSRAQGQLRQIFTAPELRAHVMPGVEFLVGHSLQAFDEAGNLKDPELVAQLDGIMRDFNTFMKVNEQLVEERDLSRKAAEEFSWDR